MANPYAVVGELKVQNSATVLCLRKSDHTSLDVLDVPSYAKLSFDTSPKSVEESFKALERCPFLETPKENPMTYYNGWEVLMGQNEVINYLKSTEDKVRTMRYAGEYKLAGGNVDPGETLVNCARRELYEEFLQPLGVAVDLEDIKLRPFSLSQTRPIRSVSNLMHNYVCLAEENPIIRDLDIDNVNKGLADRRALAQRMIKDGSYWSLSPEEKEKLSPEIHKLEWVPLGHAVRLAISSFLPGHFVNKWQKDQFMKLSEGSKTTKRRDPNYMTAAALVEVEVFSSVQNLVSFCNQVDFANLRLKHQYLFEGMTNAEVVKASAPFIEYESTEHLVKGYLLDKARAKEDPNYRDEVDRLKNPTREARQSNKSNERSFFAAKL